MSCLPFRTASWNTVSDQLQAIEPQSPLTGEVRDAMVADTVQVQHYVTRALRTLRSHPSQDLIDRIVSLIHTAFPDANISAPTGHDVLATTPDSSPASLGGRSMSSLALQTGLCMLLGRGLTHSSTPTGACREEGGGLPTI